MTTGPTRVDLLSRLSAVASLSHSLPYSECQGEAYEDMLREGLLFRIHHDRGPTIPVPGLGRIELIPHDAQVMLTQAGWAAAGKPFPLPTKMKWVR